MTLIVSCVTRDTLYQISDRRVTRLALPHDPLDDEANKSIFVGGRAVFGYAGLSDIASDHTDIWLTRVISGGPVTDMSRVLERVRLSATEAFKAIPYDGIYKRHAFQAVAWLRLQGETFLTPAILTVHNALNPLTSEWLAAAKPEFEIRTEFPSDDDVRRGGGCIIKSIGESIDVAEQNAVVRLIRKCVKHRYSTPRKVMSALIRAFRWLARRHADRVGLGLIAVCLPRRSVELAESTGHIMLINAPADDQSATFQYVSGTGRISAFGPNMASEGMALTGFESGFGPPPPHLLRPTE